MDRMIKCHADLQKHFRCNVDVELFWLEVDKLPQDNKKYSRSLALKLRYDYSGKVQKSYREVAEALGISHREYARVVVSNAIRLLTKRMKSFAKKE